MTLKLNGKGQLTIDALFAEYDGTEIGVKTIARARTGRVDKQACKWVRDSLKDEKICPELQSVLNSLVDGERMSWKWQIDSSNPARAEEFVTLFNRLVGWRGTGGTKQPHFGTDDE